MTPDEARKAARDILVSVDKGGDPSADRKADRKADRQIPTVETLCAKFLAEYVPTHCKPRTAAEYRRAVELFIVPRLGSLKMTAVKRDDVARLHHDFRHIPYQANRTLGVLSKLFNLAELWGIRPDGSNPCRHIRKYTEHKREWYLSAAELHLLGQALSVAENEGTEPKPVISAIRLLILTGCRLREIQTLKWEYVHDGYLALPDSKTGAKRVPLGQTAQNVLKSILPTPNNPYVIQGSKTGSHWTDLERPWRRIRSRIGLTDVRLHDLRHTFASVAVSSGVSLSIIGKLLGHGQIQTTERYAHLAPNPVKLNADAISADIAAAMAIK